MTCQAQRISEVAPGFFRIVVPLPIPEIETMNSYVIVDGDRNLIVDPGMAYPSSCETMEKSIEDLGLDLGRTDFFITHHHLDHFSSVSRFLSGTSHIFISKPEAEFIGRIASGEVKADMAAFSEMLGFPEKDLINVISQFYRSEYRQGSWPFQYVADGEAIVRGRYRFTCLINPGHSIAHSCLYEPNCNILIAGDQITAGVQFLLDRANPLADHFHILARLWELDVKLTLPGHGSPFGNHRRRIDLLRAHFRGRLEAACAALGEDGKDAYEVTRTLDGLLVEGESLDSISPVMRFIRTRHSFACLQHLIAEGLARKEHHKNRILFFQDRGR
jgi:glyoxylase-like metal-dependent hydrolase (beta-lactamase superfamily II)